MVSLDSLPPMTLVRQALDAPAPVDVAAAVAEQWPRALAGRFDLAPGARVAVAVGSRGITNLPEAVRAVVARLKEAGARPFVTPAMGSHGGATVEGQVKVLAGRGITEASVGAPVEGTMEVARLGETEEGVPLFFDRIAHGADAVVLVNRIKPHTNFTGPIESGWLKMLAVGPETRSGPSTTTASPWSEIPAG
jgi:uncharacterized Fe-S center protein